MARLFVRHKVSDSGAWKRGYDAAGKLQKENSVLGEWVHRDADDPNTVVVVHTFKDVASAKRFVGLEDLMNAMKEMGVQGASTIWTCDQVE